MYRKLSNILIIILFNKFISENEHVYYSEPDLSNPNIPKELLESCGYRYRVLHYNITHNKSCFANDSYVDRVVTLPQTEFLRRRRQLSTRVLGGKDVEFREAPWVVQIVKRGYSWLGYLDYINHHCTGVLITMRYILTAAHCLTDDLLEKGSIYVGRDETTEGWRTNDFDFTQHPKYLKGRFPDTGEPIYDPDYDIAIIKLHTPIDWLKYGTGNGEEYLINTICLPLPENFSDPKFNHKYDIYRKATIFGWGKMHGHVSPRIIQRGDVTVKYTQFEDIEKFRSDPSGNNPRACYGDSGSGLVQYLDQLETRAVLIGIQSSIDNKKSLPRDKTPCDLEHIGDFDSVRVVYYLDWINEHLKQN